MGETRRKDIIDYCLSKGLIETCCSCQLSKRKTDSQLLEDLIQDTWVWLLTYDEEKLINAYNNKHLNALITQYLVNNIWSTTSPYWKKYHKDSSKTREITEKELNLKDEEE